MAGKFWNRLLDDLIYTVEVLSLCGPNADKFVRRGLRYSEQGDYDRAIRWYNKAIWWFPRNWYAFANRATAHYYKGNFDVAKQDLLTAQTIQPSWAWSHWSLGAVYRALGNVEQAITEWTLAIEGGVRESNLSFDRGYARFQLKQFNLALEDFNEAVRLASEDAEFVYWRGATHCEMGDHTRAVTDLLRVIELDPSRVQLLAAKIYIASINGDHKFKIETYEQILRDNPADSETQNNLAWVLATCPEDNLRNGVRAVELAKSACELTQFNNSSFVDTLAAAYAEAGNFEEAIKWQEQAAALYTPTEQGEWGFLIDLYRSGQPYRQPPHTDQPATS